MSRSQLGWSWLSWEPRYDGSDVPRLRLRLLIKHWESLLSLLSSLHVRPWAWAHHDTVTVSHWKHHAPVPSSPRLLHWLLDKLAHCSTSLMFLLWLKWFTGIRKMWRNWENISRTMQTYFNARNIFNCYSLGKWYEYFVPDIWQCRTFSVSKQQSISSISKQLASFHFYLQSFIIIRMINILQL